MKILAIFIAAVLAGCATYEPDLVALAQGEKAEPPASMEAVEKAVKAYFGQTLFDPESAQYRVREPINSYYVAMGDAQHGWFVCGELNAKNRFGGYVGFHPFWVYLNPHDPNWAVSGYVDSHDTYDRAARRCSELNVNRTGVTWQPAPAETGS